MKRWWRAEIAAALGRTAFVIFALLYLASLALGSDGADAFGQAMLPDFTIFYAAGEAVWQGHAAELYNGAWMWQRVEQLAPQPDGMGLVYLYPPLVAWMCVPLAWMPFPVTVWVYLIANLALGIGLGWWIARWLMPSLTEARAAFWLFAGSLPFWRCLLFGQNGFISLLILWGGWVLRRDRPLTAGLVWALGAYKPQLFAGVWLWGLLFGSWRFRAGLILGGVAMALLNLATVGSEGLLQWRETMRLLAEDAVAAGHRFAFWDAMQLLGWDGSGMARLVWMLLLGIWVLMMLLAGWRLQHDEAGREATLAFAIVGWLLVVPRIFTYDLPVVYPVMVGAWVAMAHVPGEGRGQVALGLTVLLLYFGAPAAVLGIPLITLLVLAWSAWLAVWLARRVMSPTNRAVGMDFALPQSSNQKSVRTKL